VGVRMSLGWRCSFLAAVQRHTAEAPLAAARPGTECKLVLGLIKLSGQSGTDHDISDVDLALWPIACRDGL